MIKTIEELRAFVKAYNDAEKIMGELRVDAFKQGARPRWGYFQQELQSVGLWDEYDKQSKIQDALMEEHGLSRVWENFGDDGTSEVFSFLTKLLGMDD
jgi:hypothetical protein